MSDRVYAQVGARVYHSRQECNGDIIPSSRSLARLTAEQTGMRGCPDCTPTEWRFEA